MTIWLQGPSGAGKTTVGRALAALRDIEFLDVDECIERAAGRSTVEIFRDQGEYAFRALERETIRDLISGSHGMRVVAVGGGAVQDAEVRNAMSATGVRVFLNVESDVALSRLDAAATAARPMLSSGDPREVWSRLYAARVNFYRDAEVILDASGSADEVAAELDAAIRRLSEPEWSVAGAPGGEPTTITSFASLFTLMQYLRSFVGERPCAIITDENITRHFNDLIYPRGQRGGIVATVEAGERYKSLGSIEALAAQLARAGFGRDGVIVGIGGGTVTDLAGFLGATYMRGVTTVYVPTTLLGQVDAAVGGKTGVNAAGVRNLLGVFKQPEQVLVSRAFLRSLPPREMRSGLVESLKMGVLHSEELFEHAKRASREALAGGMPTNIDEVVRLSVETKMRIVESDAHDRSLRMSLNFGHTFAHALEAVEPGVYTHGEAVAIGMIAATVMASRVAETRPERCETVTESVLPLTFYAGGFHDINTLNEAMLADKKRAGASIRFVLPTDDGYTLRAVDDAELISAAWSRAFELVESFHRPEHASDEAAAAEPSEGPG